MQMTENHPELEGSRGFESRPRRFTTYESSIIEFPGAKGTEIEYMCVFSPMRRGQNGTDRQPIC